MVYWLFNENISNFPQDRSPIYEYRVYNKPFYINGEVYGVFDKPFTAFEFGTSQGYPLMLLYGANNENTYATFVPNYSGTSYWLTSGTRLWGFDSGDYLPYDITNYAKEISTRTITGKRTFKSNAQYPTEKLWGEYIRYAKVGYMNGALMTELEIDYISFDYQDYSVSNYPITRNVNLYTTRGNVQTTTISASDLEYIDFGEEEYTISTLLYDWIIENTEEYTTTTVTIYNQDGTAIIQQWDEVMGQEPITTVDSKTFPINIDKVKFTETLASTDIDFEDTKLGKMYGTTTTRYSGFGSVLKGFSFRPNGEIKVSYGSDFVPAEIVNNELKLYAVYEDTTLSYNVSVNGVVTNLKSNADEVSSITVYKGENDIYSLQFNYKNAPEDIFSIEIAPDDVNKSFIGFALSEILEPQPSDVVVGIGVNDVFFDTSQTLYALFLEYPTPEEIVLYRYNCERIKVDKTNNLSRFGTLIGTTRSVTDLVHPTILVEDSSDYQYLTNSVNYCYIPAFHRYYYIDSIELVRDKVYNLHLSCDVLMSYHEFIYTYSAYITRQENVYNPRIRDSKVSTLNGVSRKQIPFKLPNALPNFSLTDQYNIVLTTTSPSHSFYYNEAPDGIKGLTYPYVNNQIGCNNKYLINKEIFEKVQYALYNNTLFNDFDYWYQKPENLIKSIMLYPFDVLQAASYNSSEFSAVFNQPITIGNDITLRDENNDEIPAVYVGKATIIVPYSFVDLTEYKDDYLNYEPFNSLSIYLPFFGVRNLDTDSLIGRKIRLYYIVDINSGEITAVLITDKGYTVFVETKKVALTIPFTVTNVNAIFEGVIHNTVSGVSNIMSISPKRPHLASNFINSVDNVIQDVEIQYNTSDYSGSFSCWCTERDAYIIMTRKSTTDNGSEYAKLYGRPLYKTMNLSELKGKGYTEVGNIHLDNRRGWLSEEATEIENLLKSGVIL